MPTPGAVGAAAAGVRSGSAWRRRYEERAVVRAAHNAILWELCEQTPVLIMQVAISSGNFQEKLRGKTLRVRIRMDGRELLTSNAAKARSDERQCALFDFNESTQFVLQGDDVLNFEVLQTHPIFPSRVLGDCLLPLSEVREAFGGVALTRSTGQQVVRELVISVPKRVPEEIVGALQIAVQFQRSTLAAVGGEDALREVVNRRRQAPQAAPVLVTAAVAQPPTRGAPGQVLYTADGGTVQLRSWTDPATRTVQNEAVHTDANGQVIQRVQWMGDE
eukprot:gnl/TRDRNA2_/TRDRNA2_28897_c0_seq1.p1 gnl/TRDRNA2_/TRDRNA2_28897_c0~~gnl/TRDRNA2_/TRDRNA2_28897_c0_seq1.p1  ORF type:complete len:287 (-),score=56.76 gnl/TRDRNA2_/TRDRNA2_28897_c0_seq1:50-877(-)